MTGRSPTSLAHGLRAAKYLAEFDLVLRREKTMQTLLDSAHQDLSEMLRLVKTKT